MRNRNVEGTGLGLAIALKLLSSQGVTPSALVSVQCARIREAVKNLDMDALEDACRILQSYSYTSVKKDALDRLTVAVRNFDMDACASLAQKLDPAL